MNHSLYISEMYENTQQGTESGSSALPTSIHRMIEGFYLYNIASPLLFLFEIGGCGLLSWLFLGEKQQVVAMEALLN